MTAGATAFTLPYHKVLYNTTLPQLALPCPALPSITVVLRFGVVRIVLVSGDGADTGKVQVGICAEGDFVATAETALDCRGLPFP